MQWLSVTAECTGTFGDNNKKRQTKRRGGKTTLKIGQGWPLPTKLGQMKTGQGCKELFRSYLWCPSDLASLWDRIEQNRKRNG